VIIDFTLPLAYHINFNSIMKHFKSFIFILLTFCTSNLLAQDKYIPVSQTPEQIKTYIKNHFPATTIKKEKELLNYELEVKLNDSTKLTFNKDNALIEIESKKAIPEKILTDTIYTIVKDRHNLYHCERELPKQQNCWMGENKTWSESGIR